MTQKVEIDFEPVGRRITVDQGTDLLSAAQQAGVQLVSICGGKGSCEGCRVRVVNGQVSEPTLFEEDVIGSEIADGFRQACQCRALSTLKVEIPPESLTTSQRLQLEGQSIAVAVDPIVTPLDLQIPPPTLDDLRSDVTRLRQAAAAAGAAKIRIHPALLGEISTRLRQLDWSLRLALHEDQVIAILPPQTPLLGLAVDIGTTKIAVYLVDLGSGDILQKTGIMNPQIAYGEDVISRIAYTEEHPDGRQRLQQMLVDAINQAAAECLALSASSPEQLVDAVVVGNTAMHHFFAGFPLKQLGLAPYVPAISDPYDYPASALGLHMAPGAGVHLPANIAGYVGADHVSMVLATEVWNAGKNVLALDIGTNTEISLAVGDRIFSCSCASGPAFEGAHIGDGMRAAPGAIERLQIEAGEIRVQTIDSQPAVGICGSGILDAVAELLKNGILLPNGQLKKDHPLVRPNQSSYEIEIVPPSRTGHQRPIIVNRKDISEIQLAKAAIAAGQQILLAEAGIDPADLDSVIVAGAFGTYLVLENAVAIGMLPALPAERYQQVGNAAGVGAREMLISRRRRQIAADFPARIEYIELTTHPDFSGRYMEALSF